MKNKNLMEGMEGVELSDDELKVARESHAENHRNAITDLERRESETRARISGLEKEIYDAYLIRDMATINLETAAKEKMKQADKALDDANVSLNKNDEVRKSLESEKKSFEDYKTQAESNLLMKQKDIENRERSIKDDKSNLAARLKNIMAREASLQGLKEEG